jgi:RHS repeat-associated protein
MTRLAICATTACFSRSHFTGKERDAESGLDYFGFRYYGSNMGRFMSPDLGADVFALPFANLKNPQTLNLYSYVGNNPLSRVDQDGHDFHVCADNGNGGQNCFNLTDDQYKNLYNQQNGQQGINLPGAGFGSSGTITCGGTACGTASYFEPGLQDASGPILVGVAGGVAGPGIVRSIFNAVTGLAGSGNSVTTTAVNTGDRASRLKQLFGTEGPGGVQGNPEGAARQALQRLQGSKQLPDGLSQSDLDFYRGVMDKAANSPNNPNTAVQSVRGEILNLAERILGGGK